MIQSLTMTGKRRLMPGAPFVPAAALGKGVGWWLYGAALDLDFANNRAFNRSTGFNGSPNGILTYTSPSPKLVYGDDGVLRYAPHNLLTYSEQFDNGSWTLDNLGATNPVVTANYAAAPDGSLTADRVQLNKTGGTFSRIKQTKSITAAAYIFSVYLKTTTPAATANVGMRIGSTAVNVVVTDEWQRFSVSHVATTTDSNCQILLFDSIAGNDETADILVWGAQLNHGATVTDYIPTTSAAVYSLPIDHDPITFEPLGVLIEEQRTNLLTYSEQFDNAAWTKSRVTITANAATAPDGTATADKLVEDNTVTATHRVFLNVTKAASATTYTASCYFKGGTRTYAHLRATSVGETNNCGVGIDLITGTLGTTYGSGFSSISATATDVGNGWYRVSLTFTTDTDTNIFTMLHLATDNTSGSQTYTGDGVSGAYFWGAQLEAGAFATSYIPTVASQVTRAVDQVSILTSAFGYNASEGSLVTEADTNQMSGSLYSYVASFGDGTANERMVSRSLNTTFNFAVVDGGVTQASNNLSPVALSTMYKAAFAYKQNDFAVTLDGGVVGTDVSGTVPTVTTLKLGADSAAGATLNGHIKRLTYFPTRKTNAELQVLSA